MSVANIHIRPGRIEDAPVLAELVNYAGEGLPLYLWAKMAGGERDAWSVGRDRAARETGSFSYRNAMVADCDGDAVGSLIGYRIPDVPEEMPADMPGMFVPLQELENAAPGTWYVNVLAVLPEYRGRSLGTRLLHVAEDIARQHAAQGLSIIVSDANTGARRLYERVGYAEAGRRQMVKEGWVNEGREWVLLTKALVPR